MCDKYEKLMRWVMDDVRGLPKDIRKEAKKQFSDYLMMAVMNLDIFGVIKNEEEFQHFKTDLISRM